MKSQLRKIPLAMMLAASSTLVLAACGGGDIASQTEGNAEAAAEAGGECGELNMANNPWVGYEATAYVAGYVAETKLGCQVNYIDLKTNVSWQGLGTGEVDVIIEEWNLDPELDKQYFADTGDGSALDFGPTGNIGANGWFVPPWLAEAHPDILDWQNLNKYADKFATSESDGKGQFLGSDPTYRQFDEAIIENRGLDFKVVFSGSEAATISAFRKAEKDKSFMIGFFWEPHYLYTELPLKRVTLPEYTEGCQDDIAKVACDYQQIQLRKIVSSEWAESDSSAVELVKNFEWTNDDQNLVSKYITADKMSPEDAAAKWVKDNPDKVAAWLS